MGRSPRLRLRSADRLSERAVFARIIFGEDAREWLFTNRDGGPMRSKASNTL